jgi:ABC-type multidrug transport system fused ATPase/permease subunit
MTTASTRLTVVLFVLVIVGALLPVAFNIASGALIGSIPSVVGDGMGSPAGSRLVRVLAVVGTLFVIQEIAAPVRSLASSHLGRLLNLSLRERAMRATLAPHGVYHLEEPALLDKVNQAREIGPTGMTALQAVNGLTALWTFRFTGALSAVIVARYFPLIAVGLIVFWLTVRVSLRRDFLETVKLIVGSTERLRRSNYLRSLALTPLAAKELRVFGMAEWLRATFATAWHDVMRDVWRERQEHRAKIGVITGVTAVVYGAIFVYVGRAAVRGDISVGELSVVASSIFSLGNLAALGNPDYELEYGSASLSAVPELEHAVEPLTVRTPVPAAPLPRVARQITFEDVRFRYPASDRLVFDGLDLTIEAGRSLAVVGENGAGKTTLVKLLARLYEPESGAISVDGTPLADLHPAAWQRKVAAIFQDFVHYPFTARDNVGVGALHLDHDAVARAAQRAGATAIVDALPHGWDTVLSRLYTDGADVSGGQWQRLALARALLAVDAGADVLILDEPTANLDVRAEADIYDRFLELTAGLTTILISHRFSTVRRADRIVVLEGGRIVEDGDHRSLVAAGGRYAHMFALQAARFAEADAEAEPEPGPVDA